MVGLVWGLLSNNWAQFAEEGLYTFPQGILGGALFAVANLLIPTVVNTLGLGIGFMLWNATNIGMGYGISRFGLFGVAPTVPSSPWLSAVGIAFMLGSIVVYGLIEPTLTPPRADERSPLVGLPTTTATIGSAGSARAGKDLSRASSHESLPSALLHPELPNYGPFTLPPADSKNAHVTLADAAAEKQRKAIGTVIALLVGAFLSCCLVPFANWQQTCKPSTSTANPSESTVVLATCDPLSFVFSQCLGIYVASTLAFLLYSLLHRFVLRRSMPRSVMRPAYACGVLWGLGLGGQLYATGQLGFDQAYPVTSIGPAMVSMLWSACYFREIQGPRNLAILAAATTMVLVGTVLRVVSA